MTTDPMDALLTQALSEGLMGERVGDTLQLQFGAEDLPHVVTTDTRGRWTVTREGESERFAADDFAGVIAFIKEMTQDASAAG